MWGQLVVAFFVALVLLFVPGTVLARAARFAPLQCLGFAPALSVAGYAASCLAFERIGLPTNIVTVSGGALLAACIVFAAAWLVRRAWFSYAAMSDGPFSRWAQWLPMAVVYLVVPLAACTVLFLKPMDGADAFMQAFDNVSHLGTIRGALDSGLMDPLGAVGYYTAVDEAAKPFSAHFSFYPEMWHMIVAMVTSASGGSIPVAINAVNVVFSFVAMPFGVAALCIELFGTDRRKVLLGAFGCIVFEAFPWGMLVYGPLYPNVASFCLVPSTVALLLFVLHDGRVGAAKRVVAGAFFMTALMSCAVIQPNAAFTVGVLVAPLCVWKVSRLAHRFAWAKRCVFGWCILFGAIAIALICVLWVLMFNLPSLYAVVHNNWPSISSAKRALLDVAMLGLMRHPLQPIVASMVFVGIVRTIRVRKWLWLTFSYLLCCVMYFACAATDGFWDSLLTGFWYSDQYRIAGMVGLAGIPLFVLGFDWMIGFVVQLMRRRHAPAAARKCAAVMFVALVVAIVFFCPSIVVRGHDTTGAFSAYANRVAYLYNPHSFRHLSYEESEFAEQAQALVGESGLIANQPFDGSVYLFGFSDMPVYYKSLRGFGDDSEKANSVLVREHLSEIATSEAVQRAVRAAGIRYVLVLDQGDGEKRPHPHGGYKMDQWTGINSITDETAGFKVLLSEGDMRLYEIDSAFTAPVRGEVA